MAGVCRCPSEDDSIGEEAESGNFNAAEEEGVLRSLPDATPAVSTRVSATGIVTTAAAPSALGFTPQKRPFWNPLLPYADALDEESNRWLAEIKAGVGRAILLQELRPAFSWEVESLKKYLRVYQKKFSKDDHVYFIKIFYTALNQTDLEPSVISQLCDILVSLLDEPKLLSPQVLKLEWRSLYETVERLAYNKFEQKGLWRNGTTKVNVKIWSVVPLARPYFGVEATKEMLEEWRPWLCPFDGVIFNKAMKYLHNFLPTKLPPASHAAGFKLWFDEMINMWLHSTGGNIYCGNGIEAYLNSLFSRLAEDNVGYIDWDPYLPELFNRFFRALRLPGIPSVTPASFPVVTMSRWLISALRPTTPGAAAGVGPDQVAAANASANHERGVDAAGVGANLLVGEYREDLDFFDVDEDDECLEDLLRGDLNENNSNDAEINESTNAAPKPVAKETPAMVHIRRLFSVADTYFHPSNHGNWTEGLLQFMRALTDHLSQRLWRERQEKPSWMTAIPPSWKLSDEDVELICDAILPVAWKAMYSKAGSEQAAMTLRNIAFWQPDKVIPIIFQKVLDDFGNLTEPHRLFSTLRCAMRIGNAILHEPSLFKGDKSVFVRSLRLALPGLDVNDPAKTTMTLNFFVALLPLVDPAEAAELEDIMEDFFERVLSVIENAIDLSTLLIVDASTMTLLRKRFPAIFEKIRRQVFRHVTSTFFDAEAAEIPCHLAAFLVTNICEAAPEEGLALFLPKLCKEILELANLPKIIEQETPDDEMFWNMNIVCPLISIGLPAMEPYVDDLVEITKLALRMRCKKLRELGCEMLAELLRCLTTTTANRIHFDTAHLAVNVGNVAERDSLLSPLVSWRSPDAASIAKAQRVFDDIVFPAIDTLMRLANGDAATTTTMTKDEIVAVVQIVASGVEGAAEALPPDETDSTSSPRPVESILPDFLLRRKRIGLEGNPAVVFKDAGKTLNVRTYLKQKLHDFLKRYVVVHRPDDVQTTSLVCATFEALLFDFGKTRSVNENENKIYSNGMQMMMNPISRQWLYTPESFRLRLNVTHGDRLVHDVRLPLSPIDKQIVQDMIELSRSRYTAIGRVAQSVLHDAIGIGFSFSWMLFMDEILAPLKWEEWKSNDPEGKAFHGALATVAKTNLVSKVYWPTIRSTWLTLVSCHHDVASERSETQNLLQDLIVLAAFAAETLDLRFTFDSTCLALAKELWRSNSAPFPSTPIPTPEDMDHGLTMKNERNAKNLAIHQDLVSTLTAKIRDDSVRLKSRRGAMDLLSSLFRKDQRIADEVTRTALQLLLHPDIETRDWAMDAVIAILYQLEEKPVKTDLALSDVLGETNDRAGEVSWCILAEPKDMAGISSESTWSETNFVDETFRGYYGWKEPIRVLRYGGATPATAAVSGDARRELFKEFFTDGSRVAELIETLSLDLSGATEGGSNFSEDRVEFWTILCIVVGEELVAPNCPLIIEAEQLIMAKEKSTQGCLAEILAGVVKGSRDWSFSAQQRVWSWASKVIVNAVDNILVETKSDWITALIIMTKNRDPRRVRWLLNLVLEKLHATRGINSFRESHYLSALHGVLISMSWKIPYVMHLVGTQIQSYLSHPYKDIRLPVANILAHVFSFNWKMPGTVNINFPSIKAFIQPHIEDLKILNLNSISRKEEEDERYNGDIEDPLAIDEDYSMPQLIERVIPLNPDPKSSEIEMLADKDEHFISRRSSIYVHQQVESVLQMALRSVSQTTQDMLGSVRRGSSMYIARETDKYKTALVKCKTVMAFLVRFGSINLGGMGSEFVDLFPSLCSLSGEEKSDEELKTLLRASRRSILSARYSISGLKKMLRTLESCAVESLWHSRLVVANSIPVFVTANLFLLQRQPEYVKGIKAVVLKLLIDERLEVRQEAQLALTTLLHFHFLSVDRPLLASLFGLARLATAGTVGKPIASDQTSGATLTEVHMQKCHGGILGLCAVVLAFPYEVPRFIPAVLMELCRHVHDPNPIKSSVTQAFSEFRRTHMDNWAEDQLRFTEEQRQALVDVLVSPSYYV